jgi:hypothetical protein
MQTATKKRANSAYRNYRKTATKRIPTDFFNQVSYFSQLLDAHCRLECRVTLATEEGAIHLGSVAFDASGYSESDEALSLIQKIENLEMSGSITTPYEVLDLPSLTSELAHPACSSTIESLVSAANPGAETTVLGENLTQLSMMATDLSESFAVVSSPAKATTVDSVKLEILKIMNLCLSMMYEI